MSEYLRGSVERYLDDLAGNKPAPGGGSAAALSGALAAASAAMAANFTLGREEFVHVEPRVRQALEHLTRARNELQALVDEDVAAYLSVSQAYAMPRSTDAERAARERAVQEALRSACGVPLRVCQAACKVLQACEDLVDICNPRLVSDVAVGAVLARAAFEAGQVNVEVNLAAMKDADFVAATRRRLEADLQAVRESCRRVLDSAQERMSR